MPIVPRRNLPNLSNPITDLAGGPIEAGQALGGVLGKAVTLSPDDLMELHELLGKPLEIGKRLLRLSSVDPSKNQLILHSATDGERVAHPIDEFLKVWRKIGNVADEPFPEGSVMSEPGTRAPGGQLGPRGGLAPIRRTIPKTATR